MLLIVASIERSGTTTLTSLLRKLCVANRTDLKIEHETAEFALHAESIKFFRGLGRERLTRILRGWTHDIEVSTSIAFAMPTVFDVFGPTIKIVHLKRERNACVTSTMAHQKFVNPEDFDQYVADRLDDGAIYRPTAVDTGQMNPEQWLTLSGRGRWEWLYDAAHRAIEAELPRFADTLSLTTNDLNCRNKIEELAKFVDPAWKIPDDMDPMHINSSFFVPDYVQRDGRILMENLFRHFDWHQAAKNPAYPFSYFKLMMFQLLSITGDAQGHEQLRQHLKNEALDILARVR